MITEGTVPSAVSELRGITAGPDGALWFTEFDGNKIGRAALVQTDAFFTGEQSVGALNYLQFQDGIPFGYYGFLQGSASTASAWLFHADLGYEYAVAGAGTGVFLYDLASGHWWYTSASLFSYLYDFTLNDWLYYFPNTSEAGHYTANPRYFANLTTGQIIKL
jgi:hypothetical protein